MVSHIGPASAEAVEPAGKECPAPILMDLTMPTLGGLEARRLIRGVGEICDVIIVAFTALYSGEMFLSASSFLQLAQGFIYRGVVTRPLPLLPLLTRLPVVRALP